MRVMKDRGLVEVEEKEEEELGEGFPPLTRGSPSSTLAESFFAAPLDPSSGVPAP